MDMRVSISRTSNDEIHISIDDKLSGIEFVDLTMSIEAFGFAVTGLSSQEAKGEVRGLQYIGKKRVTERRTVECPLTTYNKNELRTWLKKNCQEDGWLLDSYLGSQSSVYWKDGKIILNYSVTKYVDPE